ncbi:sulfurtransferase complex subunit TusD [Caviibacterium pharyngocola]|uniref:Sulfurtransferase complex subunit TusD n=1 Tax=Caviibacterium pharyngocola TaxID=28159 RepID=A0A2M8RWI3_9PAST|nr:sulfurtransferase complex subunit TusD [Caviibacterium pharyngocola]PJG83221.1 sulfurtransferase complex subunit TusD [Caviibacterium pharyngocola]
MRYVLAVKAPVYGTQGAFSAYQFAEALLAQGHRIDQIFFFRDGVMNGNAFIHPANDEFHLQQAWQTLGETHQIPLHLCIAASQRRGVVDPLTTSSEQHNLASGFVAAGLGEFMKAVLEADRVITL